MKRGTSSCRVPLAVALLLGALAGFSAPVHAQVPIGGFSAKNLEWLGNVSLLYDNRPIGARVRGRYFYLYGASNLYIFDISDPTKPVEVGRMARPGVPLAAGIELTDYQDTIEDPDTNGKILLASGTPRDAMGGIGYILGEPEQHRLYVIDVTDKSQPKILSSIGDGGDHTWSCLLNCTWAYGATGKIVDLRDPRKPRLLAGRWTAGLDLRSPTTFEGLASHDVTEVAPGIVLTASVPMYLLDARDPLRPRALAKSDGSPNSYGGVDWPDPLHNDVMLSFNDPYLNPPRCEVRDALEGSTFDSTFKTWDASRALRTGLIVGADEYRVQNGTFVDGNPPMGPGYALGGCKAYHFDAHGDFSTSRLVVQSFSSHGVKLLRVGETGAVREVGHFLGVGTQPEGAYWASDRIIYSVDYNRGIDILRYTGDLPA